MEIHLGKVYNFFKLVNKTLSGTVDMFSDNKPLLVILVVLIVANIAFMVPIFNSRMQHEKYKAAMNRFGFSMLMLTLFLSITFGYTYVKQSKTGMNQMMEDTQNVSLGDIGTTPQDQKKAKEKKK